VIGAAAPFSTSPPGSPEQDHMAAAAAMAEFAPVLHHVASVHHA
jgi:hypothetical protein